MKILQNHRRNSQKIGEGNVTVHVDDSNLAIGQGLDVRKLAGLVGSTYVCV